MGSGESNIKEQHIFISITKWSLRDKGQWLTVPFYSVDDVNVRNFNLQYAGFCHQPSWYILINPDHLRSPLQKCFTL